MVRINITKLTCKRCGHKWCPRKGEVMLCPHCKSPYWNKTKSKKVLPLNGDTVVLDEETED